MGRTGLVLEGGGMRGIFSCGIIDVFLENNITFDGMAGTSAGAAFGCNFKSKQIGRGFRYNKKYCRDKRYVSYASWLRTGDLFPVDFCYDELIHKLDIWDQEAFAANPMEFYAVATDIVTGEAVYHKCEKGDNEDVKWIRASASMPVFSNPVFIGDGAYLDGGITDPIPVRFMEKQGYEKLVVIETQPRNFVKMPQKYMGVVAGYLKNYPKAIAAMKRRYKLYNRQKGYIREQERLGKLLVIRPDEPLNISSAPKDPSELERVYGIGREKGMQVLTSVKEYMGQA